MARIVIKIVGIEPATGGEAVLARRDANLPFSSGALERLIDESIHEAGQSAASSGAAALRAWQPELVIALSSPPEEDLRPAFHLGRETIRLIADAGCDVDFDPYCWQR